MARLLQADLGTARRDALVEFAREIREQREIITDLPDWMPDAQAHAVANKALKQSNLTRAITALECAVVWQNGIAGVLRSEILQKRIVRLRGVAERKTC